MSEYWKTTDRFHHGCEETVGQEIVIAPPLPPQVEHTPFSPPITPQGAAYPGEPVPQRLLPTNATSLEVAVEQVITDTLLQPVIIRDLWNPWTCPMSFLPYLAWAVAVPDWNTEWPEETKRRMTAVSMLLRREHGTPNALRRALDTLDEYVGFQEWFQYGGSPYRFRLLTAIGEDVALPPAKQADIIRVALAAKNTRSHLDNLTVMWCADLDAPRVCMATTNLIRVTIPAVEMIVPPPPFPPGTYIAGEGGVLISGEDGTILINE